MKTYSHSDFQVADATIGDVRVSTVWLHRDKDGHESYETMVFGGPLDQSCWRYATEREARKGHSAACALVQAAR